MADDRAPSRSATKCLNCVLVPRRPPLVDQFLVRCGLHAARSSARAASTRSSRVESGRRLEIVRRALADGHVCPAERLGHGLARGERAPRRRSESRNQRVDEPRVRRGNETPCGTCCPRPPSAPQRGVEVAEVLGIALERVTGEPDDQPGQALIVSGAARRRGTREPAVARRAPESARGSSPASVRPRRGSRGSRREQRLGLEVPLVARRRAAARRPRRVLVGEAAERSLAPGVKDVGHTSTHAEDADGRRAAARRRAGARVRALPRRRQQPRVPRLLRAARGARDERGLPDERAARLHEHALQAPADYRPKGVAVAWDTRPVHRQRPSSRGVYKADRRPMPDLLREQFPHFRPIVEAFGYRNLEFEGWEADDVIATLATRADEAGVKTRVVSTDRDAFQLVLREHLPDDDAARRLRRQRLHARAGRGPATASAPSRCRTSSASRATPPTTSPASRGSATRRPAS